MAPSPDLRELYRSLFTGTQTPYRRAPFRTLFPDSRPRRFREL